MIDPDVVETIAVPAALVAIAATTDGVVAGTGATVAVAGTLVDVRPIVAVGAVVARAAALVGTGVSFDCGAACPPHAATNRLAAIPRLKNVQDFFTWFLPF